jgi:hypothetical protein
VPFFPIGTVFHTAIVGIVVFPSVGFAISAAAAVAGAAAVASFRPGLWSGMVLLLL